MESSQWGTLIVGGDVTPLGSRGERYPGAANERGERHPRDEEGIGARSAAWGRHEVRRREL